MNRDITDFGTDWVAALDEAARWDHDCSVEYRGDGHGGTWAVVYRGDVNNLELTGGY